MPSDIEIYVKGMAEVRHRLGVVQARSRGPRQDRARDVDAELIFIQLRKTLELIAFGSLCASKQKYAEVHKNFAQHWSAKRLLADLEKVNPDFYPEPLEPPKQLPNQLSGGTRHFHFDRSR